MSSGIGIRNLEQALLGFTRPIFYRGEVDAGALVGSIPLKNVTMVANQFQGLILNMATGATVGEWSRIASNNATTLTINPNLSVAPAEGDEIIVLAFGSEATNIQEWGGVAQTGADLTPLFQNLDIALSALRDALKGAGNKDFSTLETDVEAISAQMDVALSTRASEATLAAQLNITLSALRDALKGAGNKDFSTLETDVEAVLAQLDVALSTRASEATLAAQLNITLSALRDAIVGVGAAARTQGEIEAAIQATQPRNIAQVGGVAQTGVDLTPLFQNLDIALSALRDALKGVGNKDFSTLETDIEAILAKIIAAPATEAKQDTLIAKDFATQTTLAAVLAKIIAAPATEAKQDTLIAKDFATQTTQTDGNQKAIVRGGAKGATTAADVTSEAVDANKQALHVVTTSSALPTGAATEAKQDTLIAKDFATQTTLAAVLAKIIAAPATEAKQDTLIAKDFATQTTLAALLTEAIFTGRIGEVQAIPTANTLLARLKTIGDKDFATQTTLAAILAKIIAAPATEAKQDTLIAKDFATQTTLAAILAKIIAAPATEAKQDTLIAKDFATQTTLAAVLAKIIAAPATEAKQDTLIAKDFATQTTLATLVADATFTGRVGEVQASPTANTVLARLKDLKTSVDLLATQATLASIKDTDGIKKITDTVNVAMTGSTSTTTATIANGASLSGEADIGAYTYVAIMMPAAWTAANLTLQASNASAGTFYDVYDDAGIEVQVLADASRVIGLDLAALKLAALRYIKVRSGTTGTPVAQGAERVLTLILKK